MATTSIDSEFKNLAAYRREGSTAAVFFVHGFTGTAVETWGKFPDLLTGDVQLAGYDFFFWGYFSKKPGWIPGLEWLKKRFWEDNPTIPIVAESLKTLLQVTHDRANQPYQKIILVAHSMGGLVVQGFIMNELIAGRHDLLDRLTEVLFYATPSDGAELSKVGQYFQTQAADMRQEGAFITKLREDWKKHVEAHRNDADRLARFRLTLVAGSADQFIKIESSQGPFPNDEREIVQGNHVECTKPSDRDHDSYAVLRARLLRSTLTRHEAQIVAGEAPEVAAFHKMIDAARELRDTPKLVALATQLQTSAVALSPALWKTLGLALSGAKRFEEAVVALKRYLDMRGTPAADGEAAQQLAIAYSYAGKSSEAVALLKQLPKEIYEDPETQGILGGCFKRQWLNSAEAPDLGEKARNFYSNGYEASKKAGNRPSLIYNGINAAYLALALDKNGHREIAAELVFTLKTDPKPDYWARATYAEALLLSEDFAGAAEAYAIARKHFPDERAWLTTQTQARDIIDKRLGNSSAATIVRDAVV